MALDSFLPTLSFTLIQALSFTTYPQIVYFTSIATLAANI